MAHTPRSLSGLSSIFLDALRIIASIVVFIGHAYAQGYITVGNNFMGADFGHFSVLIFFVLSGYVIAHTTSKKNRGPLQYAQARLSRLYSVLLPTLIITAIIEFAVVKLSPEIAIGYQRGNPLPRYILSGLFLNEMWFFSASPPINGPLWSLSYEYWYYVIFGCVFFKFKGWQSVIIPLLACMIAGPKILSMMPIWLFGNIAYRLNNPLKNRYAISWFLVAGALSIAIILYIALPALPFKLGTSPLFFSAQFISDTIVSLFIGIAFWLLPSYNIASEKVPGKALKTFRKFADLTFPLYVLHEPLLVLFRVINKEYANNSLNMIVGLVIVFITCMYLGSIMEKNRFRWISPFKQFLNKIKLVIQ
ncbi:acyltransferase family protein [Mucilaginibacter polytrichastri]|uniref:Acyltransferase 3 domain-containing protein n=1 Tax=Mucilaginibacter polytrichastri TaxID=1302689 RepID=A0A1Q5ZTP3_9SPHI|nr:acyltransferase [Mucilaginibacter polytrichastri]OKS85140.1 hypothetical protein RG47T_0584 [Mucilaginibacter polytrichastri]SFS43874.1 Peptidoglycan/LPS O-acetylase OafA/YrhL, contains acyltransferase and SGNH-hydrolase domains [Mucilaginibacter polytrichastri]